MGRRIYLEGKRWTGEEVRTKPELLQVTVSYTMVDCRYSTSDDRRTRLSSGWGFLCSCLLCSGGGEEQTRTRVRSLQDQMRSLCEQEPEQLDWSALARLQGEVVGQVQGLVCAPILLLRECQSLVHLCQLARDREGVEGAVEEWRARVGEVAVPRASRSVYSSSTNSYCSTSQTVHTSAPNATITTLDSLPCSPSRCPLLPSAQGPGGCGRQAGGVELCAGGWAEAGAGGGPGFPLASMRKTRQSTLWRTQSADLMLAGRAARGVTAG